MLLDNLYTIISSNTDQIIIKLADKDHPVFKAHFPNKAILPGFLQLDIIAHILNDEIININYTKFIAHICPLDEIIYDIKITNHQKRIIIRNNDHKISEIKYETN